MKKLIIYVVLAATILTAKNYDVQRKNNLMNEVINEKEKTLYYNEFNDNYLLDDNGTIYIFEDGELKYINEFDDIEEHPEVKPYVEVK